MSSNIIRNTTETQIDLKLNIYSDEKSEINTPVPFLNHMLELFARHAGVYLKIDSTGDIEIDAHHSTEDTGIALGLAIKEQLGDKVGITRYGDSLLPMDESLVLCALDLSGRATLGFVVDFPTEKMGEFDTELIEEFFQALVRSAGITLHFNMMAGRNSHHIAEACFKAFAHAFRKAIVKTGDDKVLSTKGLL